MKSFDYVVNDFSGIDMKTGQQLLKTIQSFDGTSVKITKGNKTVNAKKVLALLGLGVREGDELRIDVEGDQEDEVVELLEQFIKEHF